MDNLALSLAGLIGAVTALFHGIVTNRLMVGPISRRLAADPEVSETIRRIVPPLLHYSMFSWLVGGMALVVAANFAGAKARRAVGLLVGVMYLYAAIANAWATRGRHPGWLLMAVAVVLIVIDVMARWGEIAV
jgi:hypothetical protein